MPALSPAALAALQSHTRTASEASQKPSSQSENAQERGSLLHTLRYEGNGFWIDTTSGSVWCGAKGYIPLDLYSACNAALLPEGIAKFPYCNLGRGCKHALPRNFEAVHSTSVVPAADLLKKDTRTEEEKRKAKAKAKGKGKGKGKGRGKGKEKEKKRKRKEKAEEEDLGDE